ncbi:hypothetical protein DXN06_00320 [Cutibacterium acnes]|uniref:Transmembrane protein n=1 Tax=Cutibacterium acnes TaxID=1747 RepID=A0AAD0QML3_CUTAC|nr:hypothetical protein DXN06_00320 [Cutibacterium acnes]
MGAACVVLGGGCVWDVFLSGLTAGEGSGMVFRAAALVVVWLAGSAGWFWDRGFGVGVVGLVGSPCDGFCMVCVGIVVVGVMFENSTVCL